MTEKRRSELRNVELGEILYRRVSYGGSTEREIEVTDTIAVSNMRPALVRQCRTLPRFIGLRQLPCKQDPYNTCSLGRFGCVTLDGVT